MTVAAECACDVSDLWIFGAPAEVAALAGNATFTPANGSDTGSFAQPLRRRVAVSDRARGGGHVVGVSSSEFPRVRQPVGVGGVHRPEVGQAGLRSVDVLRSRAGAGRFGDHRRHQHAVRDTRAEVSQARRRVHNRTDPSGNFLGISLCLAGKMPFSTCGKEACYVPSKITTHHFTFGCGWHRVCGIRNDHPATVAVGQGCTPSQVWLNGECSYPPDWRASAEPRKRKGQRPRPVSPSHRVRGNVRGWAGSVRPWALTR